MSRYAANRFLMLLPVALYFFPIFMSPLCAAAENRSIPPEPLQRCEQTRKPLVDQEIVQKYADFVQRRCVKLADFDNHTVLSQDDEGYRYVIDLTLKNNTVLHIYDVIQMQPMLDVQIYDFVDYWQDVGNYVLKVGYYEGSRHILLRDSDGKRRYIDEVPHRSSDGKRIVVVSAAEAYNRNSLEVLRITEHGWEKEFLYDIDAAGDYRLYAFTKWLGDDAVELSCFRTADERLCPGFSFMETEEVLAMKGGEWSLDILSGSVRCSTPALSDSPRQ